MFLLDKVQQILRRILPGVLPHLTEVQPSKECTEVFEYLENITNGNVLCFINHSRT